MPFMPANCWSTKRVPPMNAAAETYTTSIDLLALYRVLKLQIGTFTNNSFGKVTLVLAHLRIQRKLVTRNTEIGF